MSVSGVSGLQAIIYNMGDSAQLVCVLKTRQPECEPRFTTTELPQSD